MTLQCVQIGDCKGERKGSICLAKYLFITISGIWSSFCFSLNISQHFIAGAQLGLSFLEEMLGFWPNNNTEFHIYVIKASSVITDNFLPLLEQFSKKQIIALFSTVTHTLRPSRVTDNSRAEHVSHVQMENTGSGASCCEILKHQVTALTTRDKLRNIKRGKKKNSEKEKDHRGKSSKDHRPEWTVCAQGSGSLKSILGGG